MGGKPRLRVPAPGGSASGGGARRRPPLDRVPVSHVDVVRSGRDVLAVHGLLVHGRVQQFGGHFADHHGDRDGSPGPRPRWTGTSPKTSRFKSPKSRGRAMTSTSVSSAPVRIPPIPMRMQTIDVLSEHIGQAPIVEEAFVAAATRDPNSTVRRLARERLLRPGGSTRCRGSQAWGHRASRARRLTSGRRAPPRRRGIARTGKDGREGVYVPCEARLPGDSNASES